jgi:hypothetical protein
MKELNDQNWVCKEAYSSLNLSGSLGINHTDMTDDAIYNYIM